MRRFVLRRPINNNNIYRVINDDFYVNTIPDFTLTNMGLRNYQYPAPVYQVNGYRINDNDYLKAMKLSNEKKPIFVENLSKNRDGELSNMVIENNVLPYRPLYIQNRLDELITGKIEKPVIPASYNTILLPRNTGEVHVNKYPLVPTSYKDSAFIKQKLNSSKISSPPLSPLNDLVGIRPTTPVIQTTTPEVTEKTKLKINPPETNKKEVKFLEPIPSKYSYKNVYHKQPDKNTVVKFDNTMSSPTMEAESSTRSIPSKHSNSDFFLLPPIKKNDPLLPVNKAKTYEENNQEKSIVENKPTAEEPYTNKQDDQPNPKNSFVIHAIR